MTQPTAVAAPPPLPAAGGAPFEGPPFSLVDSVGLGDFRFDGAVAARRAPLLVKGALRDWPAWQRWEFDRLADLCEAGPGVSASMQTALTEQGRTRPRVDQAVAPYLRDLGRQARSGGVPPKALLGDDRLDRIAPGESFRLDWSRMDYRPHRVYLQQWDLLAHLPALRQDIPFSRIWPGLRRTWQYAFIGPADTLSGLHCDFPNNWFCQVRGVKEFILFGHDQTPLLTVAHKYDWGATLSEVDISRLREPSPVRERFAQARGLYARVEAGDALYIPKGTWHAVVALTPSISIGIFGLTPFEIATGGVASSVRHLLHLAHLYRWGDCTCHRAPKGAD